MEEIVMAIDGEIADEASEDAKAVAAKYRAEALMSGPPTVFELALVSALSLMVEWVQLKKFTPSNEEDVQCFLYHALVLELDSALQLHAKRTHSKPEKLEFLDGKFLVKDMHFPDLIIGDPNDSEAIYIEIKVRTLRRKSFHGLCVADVKKLAQHHSAHRQFFILFDCNPNAVYLSESQRDQLQGLAAPGCTVWYYPQQLTETVGKARAAKAIATMIKNNMDFSAMGSRNAKKAILGKRKAN